MLKKIQIAILYILLTWPLFADFSGQWSNWTAGTDQNIAQSVMGSSFIATLSNKIPLNKEITLDHELSLKLLTEVFLDKTDEFPNLKTSIYRWSLCYSDEENDLRIGRQKISFGPAKILRTLQLFDQVSPNDALKQTDGVNGILFRKYNLDNRIFWLWLLANNTELKGTELYPDKEGAFETGARFQQTLFNGDAGILFDQRTTDLASVSVTNNYGTQTRIGLDGVWDLGFGVWFEALVTRHLNLASIPEWRQQFTLGADYTFAIFNSVTTTIEYYSEASGDELFSNDNELQYTACYFVIPLNLIEQLTFMGIISHQDQRIYPTISYIVTSDLWVAQFSIYWSEKIYPDKGFQVSLTLN